MDEMKRLMEEAEKTVSTPTQKKTIPKKDTKIIDTPSVATPQQNIYSHNLRPCKACGNMLSKDAEFCPRCGKKKSSLGCGAMIVAAVFGIVMLIFVISVFHNQLTGSGSGVSVGKEGILDGGGVETLLTVSDAVYDEWSKAKVANDKYGMGILLTTGKAFTIKSGTKVLVIDQSMFKRKVRIIEGEQAGISGWTAAEHVR
jgi:hypothetical protein